jgi:hypothetical protein
MKRQMSVQMRDGTMPRLLALTTRIGANLSLLSAEKDGEEAPDHQSGQCYLACEIVLKVHYLLS